MNSAHGGCAHVSSTHASVGDVSSGKHIAASGYPVLALSAYIRLARDVSEEATGDVGDDDAAAAKKREENRKKRERQKKKKASDKVAGGGEEEKAGTGNGEAMGDLWCP